ncbi:N-acetyl sugar amidotransferase [Phaeospirillum tilakii]|uniref:N-acetyl sugar amidotransferase n=1 Tax=Phaeospirillum tilakii TaxID=741673 RepID=A0ABW5CFF1_9PROT
MTDAHHHPHTVEKDGKVYMIDPNDGLLEVRHGLPPEVRFCKRCVISNQRAAPSVVTEDRAQSRKSTVGFGDDGVCFACRAVKAKREEIDWEERERKLITLLDKYRSRNGSWDVLIPGSGGKDSVYAAHILKKKYGMNPLTVTWAPHMYTDVGWRNFQSWIHNGGFDNILFTPNGRVHRKLTRLAYETLLHPFQPFVFGQRNFPARVAMERGIPLVFYGESPAEYGTAERMDLQSVRPRKLYTGNPDGELYVSGHPIDDLRRHGITREMLRPYLPISEDDADKAGLDMHYLGWFLKWIPQECYYYSVENVGFEANDQRTEGTYSKYNSIDDKLDGFHYWTGFIKFGIGRCTHEASQEIRHGHITREEGVALVHKFDGEFPNRYFKEVLAYMDMEEAEFLEIADRWRSPHLWKQTNAGWVLRHQVR